jgi:hypothetical protein
MSNAQSIELRYYLESFDFFLQHMDARRKDNIQPYLRIILF